MSTATPPIPPDPPGPDERLTSGSAFTRFVSRVTPRTGCWLARRDVPTADREDVLQDALLQAFKKRFSFDPTIGPWEAWFFGYVGGVVNNYRKTRGRRLKRVAVAREVLPDIAVDGPNQEEELDRKMMARLLERCIESLDPESRSILLAKDVDGIPMEVIAKAHGVALSTAYLYYKAARERLQEALDGEQGKKRALGVAVFPIALDQLIASDNCSADVGADTMTRIWKNLDRAMADAVSAGELLDDGAEVPRYMGSPNIPRRPRLAARILRALGPRAVSALTHLGTAAIGGAVVYALMKPGPAHDSKTADVRAIATGVRPVSPPGPAPADTAAPSTAGSSGPVEEPELRPAAGAPERTGAGSGPSTTARPDVAAEQDIFDLGNTAYQAGAYEDAIKHFEEHARKHPRGRFAGPRDRLWTLALILTGRKTEARQRIDQLRRANPQSKTLTELEVALNPAN